MRFVNVFTLEKEDGSVIVIENAVKDEAINSFLNVYFGADAKIADWYIGLIDNTGFTATANEDTAALHTGWSEFILYDEAVRQDWDPTTSTAQSVTGTTTADFTISTVVVGQKIQGLFVADLNTKTGSTGLLFATAEFAVPVEVLTAEIFKVTYTVRLIN